MKRFRFAQASVLRLKDQQRRQADGRLQLALRRQEATQRQLQRLDADLRQLSSGPKPGAPAADVSAWLWCRWASQLQSIRRDVLQQLARDEAAARQAREELKQLEIEVEALQSLQSMRWREYRKELSLQTQRELDATVLLRWTGAHGTESKERSHV